MTILWDWRLTLSWRRPLSYRNQSTDLQSKSMDWFLYDNGLRHERVKGILSLDLKFHIVMIKGVLTKRKANSQKTSSRQWVIRDIIFWDFFKWLNCNANERVAIAMETDWNRRVVKLCFIYQTISEQCSVLYNSQKYHHNL